MWRMPAFVPSQLSAKEIADMVTYWNTLPVAPRDRPLDDERAERISAWTLCNLLNTNDAAGYE
jgi:mono/diheme cytochrome c family protein